MPTLSAQIALLGPGIAAQPAKVGLETKLSCIDLIDDMDDRGADELLREAQSTCR